ncbi:uncharacterized protein LOC129216371 [Uloborus diversus]|uniref:uncharacterized protein LOC129216371 n=1 Tax=Uloborus diversus TaxID=327109 RepID=UPI00240A46B4|nr:uncharacterized protein LOC129216371 [Uloborus diversus]
MEILEKIAVEDCDQKLDVKDEFFSADVDKHDEGSSHSGSTNVDHLSVKNTVDGIRKRLEETLSKGKHEEYFKPDSDDALIIDLCDDSPTNGSENSLVDLNCAKIENKSSDPYHDASKSEKSFPSMIPLFHPRVCEQAIAKRLLKSQSSSASSVSFDSSSRETDLYALNKIKNNLLLCSDDDKLATSTLGAVSAFTHKDNSPSLKANFEGCHSETFDVQNTQKPTDVTHAAVTQFGPCKVQEVQLSSGKTVFAYERHDLFAENSSTNINYRNSPHHNMPVTSSSSSGGVRNLKEAFNAVSSQSKPAPRTKVPEEITIDDSDEEVHEIDSAVPARTSNTPAGQSSVLSGKSMNRIVKEHNTCSATNNLNL